MSRLEGALRTIALSYHPVSIPGDCTKLGLSSPVVDYFAEGFDHESQENCKDIAAVRRLISVTKPFACVRHFKIKRIIPGPELNRSLNKIRCLIKADGIALRTFLR